MILEHLVITDFRVFRGQNYFDLNPRKKWNRKQPIVLFGGLNGTGKNYPSNRNKISSVWSTIIRSINFSKVI